MRTIKQRNALGNELQMDSKSLLKLRLSERGFKVNNFCRTQCTLVGAYPFQFSFEFNITLLWLIHA